MKIFNTKTRKKEDLKPIEKGKIGFYLCGPTVYDIPHLGHGRSAVSFDVMRKYLEYTGYEVNFVSNYTDIDDKMIKRAEEEGISVKDLSEKVIPEYKLDYGRLGVSPPSIQPRATDHIEEMIEIIRKLEAEGHIYSLDDGVYFDIKSFPAYGEFSGQKLEDLQMGARIAVNEAKKNPYDFALWKFKKDGEPFWPSPWGEGRPGWHIECSAMSFKHLGKTFDIHGGGLDLVFPHHECEVAQSVGAFGPGTFAKYWIHNGFINVDNEKMSKSLGNFSTLRDIFEKYDPLVVRLMFLKTHYRNPINFSTDLLDQAKAELASIHNFVRRLKNYEPTSSNQAPLRIDFEEEVKRSMDNDFDTSGALGTIFKEVVNVLNRAMDNEEVNIDASLVLDQLRRVDSFLGVIFPDDEDIDEEVEGLIKERSQARKDKNFSRADEIRAQLKERGIELDDTQSGTIWKKV